jgi:hypothetical protein
LAESGNLLSNDETYSCFALQKAGLKTPYAPGVQVSHRILPDRTTLRWLLRRWYWQGIPMLPCCKSAMIGSLSELGKAVKTLLGLLPIMEEHSRIAETGKRAHESVSIRSRSKFAINSAARQFIAEAFTFRMKRITK